MVQTQKNKWLLATNFGIYNWDGVHFTLDESNSDSASIRRPVNTNLHDKEGRVWAIINTALWKKENGQWSKQEIAVNQLKGMTYSDKGGLVVYGKTYMTWFEKNEWKELRKEQKRELPYDIISKVVRDSKGIFWLNAVDELAQFDPNGRITRFQSQDDLLKDYNITAFAEDEEGNIYLGLYPMNTHNAHNEAALAKIKPDGSRELFTVSNSGIPGVEVSSLVYDPQEKVLWMSTMGAGIVRFDTRSTWELYHHLNSPIFHDTVFNLIRGIDGNLYAATLSGIISISKK
jgi:ligand-binding sensor domain-containing protein